MCFSPFCVEWKGVLVSAGWIKSRKRINSTGGGTVYKKMDVQVVKENDKKWEDIHICWRSWLQRFHKFHINYVMFILFGVCIYFL